MQLTVAAAVLALAYTATCAAASLRARGRADRDGSDSEDDGSSSHARRKIKNSRYALVAMQEVVKDMLSIKSRQLLEKMKDVEMEAQMAPLFQGFAASVHGDMEKIVASTIGIVQKIRGDAKGLGKQSPEAIGNMLKIAQSEAVLAGRGIVDAPGPQPTEEDFRRMAQTALRKEGREMRDDYGRGASAAAEYHTDRIDASTALPAQKELAPGRPQTTLSRDAARAVAKAPKVKDSDRLEAGEKKKHRHRKHSSSTSSSDSDVAPRLAKTTLKSTAHGDMSAYAEAYKGGDPRDCPYYGNKEVRRFMKSIGMK